MTDPKDPPSTALTVYPFDLAAAQSLVDRGIDRYIAERRAKIPDFVKRYYSWRGAAHMHRHAMGWDLARAPVNVALAVPTLAGRLTGAALRFRTQEESGDKTSLRKRWGDRLAQTDLSFPTQVAKELEWALQNDLLELPCAMKVGNTHRERREDALAAAILADPDLDHMMAELLLAIGRHGDDPEFRDRLTEALVTYAGTRTAAGEIASGLITMGVGAVTVQQFTPSALSLGPALAGVMAQNAAIASFPLGSSLGGLWYGVFNASASPLLTVGVTGGLMAGAAVLVAFAGMLTDPLQKELGLHQKRLNKLIDSLEARLKGDTEAKFTVRDHYAARVLDLVDVLRSAYRLAT